MFRRVERRKLRNEKRLQIEKCNIEMELHESICIYNSVDLFHNK